MIGRGAALLVLAWVLGFLWFALFLPQPLEAGIKGDAVIVLTGGRGRIERGLAVLEAGEAREMFVSGVDREVRPREFAAEFDVPAARMRCCVTLGFAAVDTRSNAKEAAQWLADRRFDHVRLVTTDWHMRRALSEFRTSIPASVRIDSDAVASNPALGTLFVEYNKYLASLLWRALPL